MWLELPEGLLHFRTSENFVQLQLTKRNGLTYTCTQKDSEFLDLNRKLNPRFTFTVSYILKLITSGISVADNLSIEESLVKLRCTLPNLKSKAVFTWEFPLAECEDAMGTVFTPLLAASSLLVDQRNALVALVKKKDKEIEEYKSLGLTLSKKTKLSEPFDNTKTLSSVRPSRRTLSEMLARDDFGEAFKAAQDCDQNGVAPTGKGKRAPVPTGITFEDSFSQPDPPTVEAEEEEAEEVREVAEEEVKVEESKQRKKKTRRL